jgi:hypothetical protein
MLFIGGIILLLSDSSAIARPKFVPLHTKSAFKGILKFFPNDGSHPFKCKVRLVFYTNKGNGPENGKPPEFNSAKGLDCSPLFFFDGLPWLAGPSADGMTAIVISVGWAVQGGPSCSGTQTFSINKTGVWTTTSGCFTGSLTSNPPITIKP